MNYTDVKDPVYGSADKTSIICQVKFDSFPNYLPFSASPKDVQLHGQKIFAELVAGKYGTIGPYVAPVITVTPQQQYNTVIANGLTVTSSSAPALNGVYGVASDDQANIISEAQFISIYQQFTNGLTSFAWADIKGAMHTFPSTALFMAFAKASAMYVSGCKQTLAALQNGQVASFPASTVNIG